MVILVGNFVEVKKYVYFIITGETEGNSSWRVSRGKKYAIFYSKRRNREEY